MLSLHTYILYVLISHRTTTLNTAVQAIIYPSMTRHICIVIRNGLAHEISHLATPRALHRPCDIV